MSFHPITLDSKTWNESGPGRYMESTVTFGGPSNYLKISPGTTNSKTGQTTAAITRYYEKDVVVAGQPTVRQGCTVTLSVQTDARITVDEIDLMCANLSDFVTNPVLTRILNGER